VFSKTVAKVWSVMLYVTFMNSYLVNLYASGMGPDALFSLYYGQELPKRTSTLSPWEDVMHSLLDVHNVTER
jgi:hypothetical protein